jgi:hypothetical protein
MREAAPTSMSPSGPSDTSSCNEVHLLVPPEPQHPSNVTLVEYRRGRIARDAQGVLADVMTRFEKLTLWLCVSPAVGGL